MATWESSDDDCTPAPNSGLDMPPVVAGPAVTPQDPDGWGTSSSEDEVGQRHGPRARSRSPRGRDNSGSSSGPTLADPSLPPPPPTLPGCGWWQVPLNRVFRSIRTKLQRLIGKQTQSRKLNCEFLCFGTGGEVWAMKVGV